MRLGEINRASSARPSFLAADGDTGHAEPSRALVALSPTPIGRDGPAIYRQAPFLAQLIATKDQHPQTRERRRAETGEALNAYRDAADLMKLR
jgi:hypothetical protein